MSRLRHRVALLEEELAHASRAQQEAFAKAQAAGCSAEEFKDREAVLLEMLGEREEEADALREELETVKSAFRAQLDELCKPPGA